MLLNQGRFEGNKIIDPTVLQEIQTPQIIQNIDLATGHVGFYGIGWNVNWNAQGNLRISHSGGFELGTATNIALIPDQKIYQQSLPVNRSEKCGKNASNLSMPIHSWIIQKSGNHIRVCPAWTYLHMLGLITANIMVI